MSTVVAMLASAACVLTSAGDASTPNETGFRLIAAVPLSATNAAMTTKQLASRIGAAPVTQRATATAPQREQQTREQVAATIAPDARYTYQVDSRRYAGADRAAAAVNIITPDECMQHYLDGYSGDYWFKNRFAGCRAMILLGDYQVCSNGKCKLVGRWKINLGYVFNMGNNDRSAEIQIKMTDLRLDPDVPGTAMLKFGVSCWDPTQTAREACNPETSMFEHTSSQWNTIGVQSTVVRFTGESPAQPADPALNEHRSFYDLTPFFYLSNGVGDTFVNAPVANLRCDIARTAVNPQYARTSDCVFHKVAGVFTLSASDAQVAESAQFIRQAQTNLASTYPGSGNYVPGQQGITPPLTRLYYDQPMRDANRKTSITACQFGFGKDYTVRPNPTVPGETNDCDEYPFAATHQGSYLVKWKLTPGSYAVKPVLSTHNQNAGARLGAWEADDHLLEEDPFYTAITN